MTVPISSISDHGSGIYAVTGPCSMASPCPGETCAEHGRHIPTVSVVPLSWTVLADGEEIGTVSLIRFNDSWRAYDARVRAIGHAYPTQAEAVSAVVARAAEPEPVPCPTCGCVTR